MKIHKKSACLRIAALFLVFSFIAPFSGYAAVAEVAQPYASDYLDSYNSYVCAMGGGRLEIWFSVTGDTDMDEIGTLSIKLFESTDGTNWTWKKTFLHEDYSSMLAYDDFFHSSYVPYQGVAGRYYKAYVCIWAGKDGNGDTRYMWTSVERAT